MLRGVSGAVATIINSRRAAFGYRWQKRHSQRCRAMFLRRVTAWASRGLSTFLAHRANGSSAGTGST